MTERAGQAVSPIFDKLKSRFISAVLVLPVVLFCLWHGGYPFTAMIALVGIVTAVEWVGIMAGEHHKSPSILLAVMLLLLALAGHAGFGAGLGFYIFALLAVSGLCLMLDIKLSPLGGGFAYVGLSVLSLILMRGIEQGGWLVLFVLLTVWVTDIMAYFFGKSVGGPRLAPVISPNKTWAGLLGGMLGAACAGAVLSLFIAGTSAVYLALLGSLSAVVAQLGDLFESSLKRKYDVKDSGNILPGHGGMLDRLDGLLAVSIAMFFWLIVRSFEKGLSAKAVLVW